MPSVTASAPSKASQPPPRVLIVDDEPGLREVVEDVVKGGVRCRVLTAANVAEARKIIQTTSVQLLLADVHLPDGNGTTLIGEMQRCQPNAAAIVITGSPSVEMAISAMREGALDFMPKPFSHDQLVSRVKNALDQQAKVVKAEARFDRLKQAVKRLNESRKMISKKVDLLCNDLVSAYGELSRQLDDVRTQEGFRKYIADAADLEQLLCHAMDWLLRQVGYCNVAVFLAGEDGAFQLGAYMKYTLTGDTPLTEALKRVLLPPTTRQGILHANAGEFASKFSPSELNLMKGQDILGVNCTYLGESLACMLFFRDSRSPFSEEDENLLRSINAIFAISLASVVREFRGGDEEEDGPTHNTGGGLDDGPRPKHDPADWWKHGGDSPY